MCELWCVMKQLSEQFATRLREWPHAIGHGAHLLVLSRRGSEVVLATDVQTYVGMGDLAPIKRP